MHRTTLAAIAGCWLLSATATAQTRIGPKRADGTTAVMYEIHELLAPDQAAGRERAMLRRLVHGLIKPQPGPSFLCEVMATPKGEAFLVLLGTPSQHRWIDKLVATGTGAAPFFVYLEVWTYRVPNAAFEQLIAPVLVTEKARKLEGGNQVMTLSAGKKRDALLAGLNTAKGIQRLVAPRVLANPMQRATIQVGSNLSYIKEWKLTDAFPVGPVADPVIATIREGFALETFAALIDKNKLGLAIDLSMIDVERPIARETKTLPGGKKVEIATPKLSEVKLRTEVLLTAADTAFLVTAEQDGHRSVITVKTEQVPAPRK